MEVQYELTADDLFSFHWRAAFESAIARRTRRSGLLSVFVVLLLLTFLPAISSPEFLFHWLNWVMIAVVFPTVAVAYRFLERGLIRRAIRELVRREQPNKGLIGRHRMVLDESGLIESTAVGESRTSWAGVDRVEQNDAYVFIYTTPTMAHVIPKRAFDGSGAQAFFEYASRASATSNPRP
jgi:hypothetical protein